MRAPGIVMANPRLQHGPQMRFSQGNQPVEALPANGPAHVVAHAALWLVVSVRCNFRCAAQVLEHVLGFRGSRALTKKIIRGAQGTYLFRDRRRDELVQRYPVSGRQFCGRLLHRCRKFQWIGVFTHFLILWSITLGVITSISKSPAA